MRLMVRPRTRLIFIGMRHGNLTVTREIGLNKYRQTIYECECDCGGMVQMRTAHFVPGRVFCTRACELLLKHRMIDLTGQRFGRWQVQSYGGRGASKNRITWNCLCDCGKIGIVDTSRLITSNSLSCGCLTRDLKTKEYTPEQRLELRRERSRVSAHKNPARVKNNKIKYELKLKRATPSWLVKDDWDYMNALYEKARRLTRENWHQASGRSYYPD